MGKKGLFKTNKFRPGSSRETRGGAGMDVFFEDFLEEDGQYDDILKNFNAASGEDKQAAIDELNEITEACGESFYGGRARIEMEWTDYDDDTKCKIINFLFNNLLPEGDYDNWTEDLDDSEFTRQTE